MKNEFAFAKGGIVRKVVRNGKAIMTIQRGLFICGSANDNATKLAEIICNEIYPKSKISNQ